MVRDLFQIHTPLFLQTIVWPIGWIITRFFLRIEIKGYENIKNLKNPVIFAVNHTSELDPIIMTAILPPLSPLLPMFYTSLESKFYNKFGFRAKIFYGGLFFKAWGAYPVKVGINDYEKSLEYHIDILKNKKGSLCIFPEGHIPRDGNLQSFKGGVAYLAHKTGVSIVPVMISSVYKITSGEFFLRKRNVVISLGAPIYKNELFEDRLYTHEEYKKIADEIRRKILIAPKTD